MDFLSRPLSADTRTLMPAKLTEKRRLDRQSRDPSSREDLTSAVVQISGGEALLRGNMLSVCVPHRRSMACSRWSASSSVSVIHAETALRHDRYTEIRAASTKRWVDTMTKTAAILPGFFVDSPTLEG